MKAIKSKKNKEYESEALAEHEQDQSAKTEEENNFEGSETYTENDLLDTAQTDAPYEDDKDTQDEAAEDIIEKITEESAEEVATLSESESTDAAELERLRAENQALRAELENAKRLESELADFASIFPEQDIRAIPDEVWQDVRAGNSLSAAFALYERKRINLEKRAEQINQLNAYRSAGQAGNNAVREYFSPDEVRAMSQSEVRANYKRIIESMKKWN